MEEAEAKNRRVEAKSILMGTRADVLSLSWAYLALYGTPPRNEDAKLVDERLLALCYALRMK